MRRLFTTAIFSLIILPIIFICFGCATTGDRQPGTDLLLKKHKREPVIDETLEEKPFQPVTSEKGTKDYSGLSNKEKKRLNRARDAINKGNTFLREGKYKQAITSFRRADRIFGKIPEVFLGLGQAYYSLEKYEESKRNFLQALEYRKGYRQALRGLGLTYYRLKEYKKVVFTYKYLLGTAKTEKHKYIYNYSLGRGYEHLNNIEKATGYYKTAIKLDKDAKRTYVSFGKMLLEDENYTDAVTILEQGLKNCGDDKVMAENLKFAKAMYHNYEGVKQYRRQSYKKAVNQFQTAISINPDLVDPYISLGSTYLRQKKYKEAIKTLKKAVAKSPDNMRLRKLYARSLYSSGSLKLALEQYLAVVKQDGTDYRSLYMIGVIYTKQESYDTAVQYYKMAIKKNDTFFDAYMNISSAYMRIWKYAEAADACRTALSILATRDLPRAQRYKSRLEIRLKKANAYALVKEGDKLFDEAAELLKKNRFAKKEKVSKQVDSLFKRARKKYQAALKLDNSLVAAIISLANADIQLKKYAAAEQGLKRVVGGLAPNNLEALYTMARLYKDTDRPQEAQDIFERIQKLQKNNPEPFYQMGITYEMREKYKEALRFFTMAEKISPSYKKLKRHIASAYYNIGRLQFDESKYNLAYNNFVSALKYQPGMELAQRGIKLIKERRSFEKVAGLIKTADSLFDRGQYNAAITRYKMAMKRMPEISAVYVSLANAYAGTRRYDKAKAVIERGLERNDKSAELYSALGVLYSKMRQPGKAVAAFDKAILTAPKTIKYYNQKGTVYFRNRDYESALAIYQEAESIRPKDSETQINLGRVYYKTGKYDQAAVSFRKAEEYTKERNVDALFNLGMTLKAKRDFVGAVECFKKVIAKQSDNAYAYFHLAHAYYYDKETLDLAIKHCDRAIRMTKPKTPLVFYWGIAMMYERKSENAVGREARLNVQRAVKLYNGIINSAPKGHRYIAMARNRIASLKPSIYTVYTHQVDGDVPRGASFQSTVFYVGTRGGGVRGIDTRTKKLVLSFYSASEITTRVFSRGRRLYFGNSRGRLFAINNRGRTTTRPVWSFQTGGTLRGNLAASDNLLFAASEDGYVYALDLRTGKMRWRYPLEGLPAADLVYRAGRLYCADNESGLFALNAVTGKRIWRRRLGGGVVRLIQSGAFVFVTTRRGLVVGVSASSGRPIWKKQLSARSIQAFSYQQGHLYVGTREGRIRKIIAASGRVLWTAVVYMPVTSNIRTIDDGGRRYLCFGDQQGSLYYVNDANGDVRWRFQLQDGVTRIAYVNAASRLIYVSAKDGSLSVIFHKREAKSN